MSLKAAIAGVGAIAAVAVAVVLIAGNDNGGSSDAEQTDDDFMALMVDHHELAIEMAEMAQERGQHAEVKALADAIVEAQSSEIEQMGSIHQRMFDQGVGGHGHGTLGMSESEMGMHADMSALGAADPFDEAFIDSMIPHHQGAIRMARIEIAQGEDGELMALAEAIIEAQSREIEEMNRWRQRWYGAPSPAGGVPQEGEFEPPSHGTMGR
jgi:uncharacterized protein (DUF305 family)